MFLARSQPSPPPGDPASALTFDDVAFESRVAWIFGSPRTGSTWLLRMLVHPYVLADGPSGLKRKRREKKPTVAEIVVPVNESHLPLHLTPIRRQNFQKDVILDPDGYLINSRHTKRPSYLFSDAHGDQALPWMRCMTLARFYSQAETALRENDAEDCVVAVKEPNGSHGAHRVMALLPNSKLIFLMRDGRDVVDSALALRLPGGGRKPRGRNVENESDRLDYVRVSSRLWVNRMNAVGQAYEAHHPDRRLLVRYENLKADTVGELTRIYGFLGLDRTQDEVLSAVEAQAYDSKAPDPEGGPSSDGQRRARATSGEWRKSLMPNEQRIAEDIMGPKLSELGYE